MKLECNVILGRAGFTDSTRATTDDLKAHATRYVKMCDIRDVHGEELRGLSWELFVQRLFTHGSRPARRYKIWNQRFLTITLLI